MEYIDLIVNILSVVIGLIGLYIIVLPLWEGYRIRKMPVTTLCATVQSCEVFVDERMGFRLYITWRGPQSNKQLKVVFRSEDGEDLTVYVPLSQSQVLTPGVCGLLTHQGPRFESFVPDRL